jgi:hypothetical protein
MSECDEEARFRGQARQNGFAADPRTTRATIPIRFDRHELGEILKVYGRKVAAGEWRDYAIDHLSEKAVFSVFRRTSEVPLYRIVKQPRLARKQGTYSVVTPTGLILRRGHELRQVLRALDKHLRVVA